MSLSLLVDLIILAAVGIFLALWIIALNRRR